MISIEDIGSKEKRALEAVFKDIERRSGGLTPKLVVEEAKAGKSKVLSKHFDFKDQKSAAESYWLIVAQRLIRTVQCVVTYDDDRPATKIRSRVRIVSPRGPSYIRIEKALSEEEYRQQLLTEALQEMRVFKRKYQVLSELATLFASMEDVEKQAQKKKRKSA